VLPLLVFWCIARNRHWISAGIVALVATYPAAVGLWEPTVETVALMAIAVLVSVVVGFITGVVAAFSPRFERAIRPVLDAMQVVPATVYLIPFLLLFGIGLVPATLSTAIYAIPPMVRLTTLGIRQVPPATVEAGHMFGSTRRQILTKVQLPQAVPSIVTGINQTINMALGIVVLAALIGAGGLGSEVIEAIRIRRPGRGFVAGFAIVAIAIVFDRVARSFVERAQHRDRGSNPRVTVAVVVGLVALTIVGRSQGWIEIPFEWDAAFADPVDDAIRWIRDHWGEALRSFNDFVVADVWLRARDLLTDTVAWPVLVGAAALLGFWLRGARLALFVAIALITTGLVGQWANAIDTFVQSMIALVVAMLIAIPIGVFAGTRPRLLAAIEPAADTLQTLPALIYAIPFVMLFTVGVVPGILAGVIYAIPAGIKLTALGIRAVPEAPLEAARSFGATNRQVLWRVRVPLALPSIVLAVNQMTMMVLANIIIAGLIGGGALGFQAINALTKEGTGLGVEVGLAIVAMALVLDRLTHAAADRFRPPASH
jgi:glycine betaine/proline transport system permease protein